MGRQCIKKLFDSTPLGQQLLSAAEVEREATTSSIVCQIWKEPHPQRLGISGQSRKQKLIG